MLKYQEFLKQNKVNENEESPAFHMLRLLKDIGHGKQKEFFEWRFNNAKKVEISKMPPGLNIGKPSLKNCYQNAYKIVDLNYGDDVFYVEGLVTIHGIAIEHAWNRIGDTYFDVTSEVLHKEGNFEEYVSIFEIPYDKLAEYSSKNGTYGPHEKEAFDDNLLNA